MKRKIASRKLKRHCICCNKSFLKGNIYYLKRVVFKEFGLVFAYEYLLCSRCKYENEHHNIRFKKFVESGNCHHPITNEVWRVMDGEDYVKEPSHTECSICGEVV